MSLDSKKDIFLWGAATAAHQVEGHQDNNWSAVEASKAKEWMAEAERRYQNLPNWPDISSQALDTSNYISGSAADHYHLYKDDINLMKEIELNSYRFSVEWSRIEPSPGVFDREATDHYRSLLKELDGAGIEPFVTLHHFSEPKWLEEYGGWHGGKFPELFSRFVNYIASELGSYINFYTTINEPESYMISRYLDSPLWPGWPRQEKSYRRYLKARKELIRAHELAYQAIKSTQSDAQVGIAHGVVWFEPYNRWVAPLVWWLDRDGGSGKYGQFSQDFIAVQYYMRHIVRPKFAHPMDWAEMPNEGPRTDMGWEVYPHGLYELTQRLKRYNLPIYITENGIADSSDSQRAEYIDSHIRALNRSIADGADIKGYFYWSLLDNYEWSSGFWPRFGLVEVDYRTNARRIRDSAYKYRDIIRSYS